MINKLIHIKTDTKSKTKIEIIIIVVVIWKNIKFGFSQILKKFCNWNQEAKTVFDFAFKKRF